MKLTRTEFELEWPQTVDVKNLRQFILNAIAKKGEVLRWSINNIKVQDDDINLKVLTIDAVILK
tara:strand:- start:2122 stop:2313 length:192 start_codon:yes stop_codon:yes gene_type:complete